MRREEQNTQGISGVHQLLQNALGEGMAVLILENHHISSPLLQPEILEQFSGSNRL